MLRLSLYINYLIGVMTIIIFQYISVFILLILSLYGDIKEYKIKNKVVVPFVLLGILSNIFFLGIDGLYSCLLGIAIPFSSLFILFALKMLGAGDVKLFCAIGSLLGFKAIIYIMAYSFISGGLIALFFLILQKNAAVRFKYLFNYLKSIFLSRSFSPYSNFEVKDDGSKFRFGYAIACGTVVWFIANVFFKKSL